MTEGPLPAAALVTPGGGKLSSEGNWKGRETGTRPPSIPKPSGREGPAEPSRALPADDTCNQRAKHHSHTASGTQGNPKAMNALRSYTTHELANGVHW